MRRVIVVNHKCSNKLYIRMDKVEGAITFHPENYDEFQMVVKWILITAGTAYILLFLGQWIWNDYSFNIFFYLLFGLMMLSYPILYPRHSINKDNFIILNGIGLEAKSHWTLAKHWKWERVMEISIYHNKLKVTFLSGSVDELKLSFYSKNQVKDIKNYIRNVANTKHITLTEFAA